MPFICIFSEWEGPPGQKIKNAFTNNLKPAIYKRKCRPFLRGNFKNIGFLKDFQNQNLVGRELLSQVSRSDNRILASYEVAGSVTKRIRA
jgi:hypothetical protein